jgi:hypothetical protein
MPLAITDRTEHRPFRTPKAEYKLKPEFQCHHLMVLRNVTSLARDHHLLLQIPTPPLSQAYLPSNFILTFPKQRFSHFCQLTHTDAVESDALGHPISHHLLTFNGSRFGHISSPQTLCEVKKCAICKLKICLRWLIFIFNCACSSSSTYYSL